MVFCAINAHQSSVIRLKPGARIIAKKMEKRWDMLEITELEGTSDNEYNIKRVEGEKTATYN